MCPVGIDSRMLVCILKGTPSKDTSWPENAVNGQIFPSVGFEYLFY